MLHEQLDLMHYYEYTHSSREFAPSNRRRQIKAALRSSGFSLIREASAHKKRSKRD
jgi:hypothetical protein